jgi:RNA polymerase sigma factor (sigma-70 family)
VTAGSVVSTGSPGGRRGAVIDDMTASDSRRTVEAVWRMESARLLAGLVRMVRDVDLAEDLAQDALLAALQQWPASGVPRNPGAWLMSVAKRRAVDHLRRTDRLERRHAEIARGMTQQGTAPDVEADLGDHIDDDLLRLMFICCHPALTPDARTTLTLRMLGGLTTKEIARSFLTSEATIAQRVVRAKSTLRDVGAPLEEPTREERSERLASVLGVLYLVFNEGYSATAGEDWMRPALCEEALRLGRVLAGIAPGEPEVHGLVALMEIQASRTSARLGRAGEPVLLRDQDRARWDRTLVRRGLAALERAEALSDGAPGPYTLQAAIAACHARARTADDTDWPRIASLYAELAAVTSSPVVQVNRAVAVAMAYGAQHGLDLLDELADTVLRGYHLLPSVRADLLARLGRTGEARTELRHAVALVQNGRERALLLGRLRAMDDA